MRFSTQMLLLQLACVTAVVAICTGVFIGIGVQQLRAEAETSALSIARTVAADTDVRSGVARISANPGTPSNASLRVGPLARIAAVAAAETGAFFVVITDDHGIRLAHPNPDRLGEVVSTGFASALAGHETVTWESGTLGESARAKVPVRDPETNEPVGEVSVGFTPASVFEELPRLLEGVALAAAAALILGALVAVGLRRRLEHLTLGVQPGELAALVQNQAAVLDGVGDGVLAYGPDGNVTVANSAAMRLLGISDLVGRGIDELDLPMAARSALAGIGPEGREGEAGGPLVLGDRVVFIDTHPVSHGERHLGLIAIVRDRTDVVTLTDRLESVASMTDALRVQRHEFANRLHVTAGLIDAGRVGDAREYLSEVLDSAGRSMALHLGNAMAEPFLASLMEAKALQARERGVSLSVSSDSLVRGVVSKPEDVATVLSNLVDNAITAAVRGSEPRWVIVELLDDGETLAMAISDSGAGIALGEDIFGRGPRTNLDPEVVHGRGIGLPLIRDVATRLGGDVWLAANGAEQSGGTVFCARLPGVLAVHVDR